MRLYPLALAAGLAVVTSPAAAAPAGPTSTSPVLAGAWYAPAAGVVTAGPPVARIVGQPQATATTAPVPPTAVVDPAPVFGPEETTGRFAYPAVFLVPIALLAGAGWSIRAFTRDLLPTEA